MHELKRTSQKRLTCLKKTLSRELRRHKQNTAHCQSEDSYRNVLLEILGGRKEVKTPFGRIDILNDDLVVECKKYTTHGVKSAIGQALCYQVYYPQHTPCIAMIGKPCNITLEVCDSYGLLYFNTDGGDWVIL